MIFRDIGKYQLADAKNHFAYLLIGKMASR